MFWFCARDTSRLLLPFVVSRFCKLFCFLPIGLFVILKTCLPASGLRHLFILGAFSHHPWQNLASRHGFQPGSSLTSVRGMGAFRSTPGTSGKSLVSRWQRILASWSSSGGGVGMAGRALKIQDAILEPRRFAGELSQPGSASERLGLQGGVSCRARSRFLRGGCGPSRSGGAHSKCSRSKCPWRSHPR